jgi:RNA recognition motif-containing protein
MSVRLFVDGIPSFFTDQQLKELFLRYGTVLSAEVAKDPRGRSLQFGYVEMAAPHEANMAILELNRSKLNGRFLLVMWDKRDTTGPTWGV